MAANSTSSAGNGKRRTTRTRKLKREQLLEILQESVRRCQEAGIRINVSNYHHDTGSDVILVLENMILDDGNLVPSKSAINGNS